MTAPQSPSSSPRPFAAAPDPSRYFPAGAMEEARQRVGRSIVRSEGPVLVIGSPGLGKTMLLEVVAQQFRNQLGSALLAGGQLCTRRALYQMILFQLGLPYKEMDESELRLSLLSHLQPQESEARCVLLLVDEADALPPRLLEELRSLTNLSANGHLLINLVMAGNATLEEQFADPKLELFSQRISARCYLSSFSREETFQYVRAQVAATGNDPQSLFTDDGLEAIFAATDGAPRLINQLGDQLMWMVAETGYSPLDSLIVQQAWSELQQLPAPWNTQASEPAGGAVEFGELSTDASELDATVFQDAVVIEDDSYDSNLDNNYAIDDDDDQPASIPIHPSQQIIETAPSLDFGDTETIDVTEQLLHQLNEMDSTPEEVSPSMVPEVTTRNPFDETFESEEIVLDQYSKFESLLLAEAPRVANRTDTAFAQQLQQMESCESCRTIPQSSPTDEASEAPCSPETRPSPAITSADFSGTPGELLVIEDDGQPQTAIVDGQKFRQLFSSLETAGNEPCFG